MTPKEIYKFIIEQSPEPLIKNPVLRNVVDQERLGFYLPKFTKKLWRGASKVESK